MADWRAKLTKDEKQHLRDSGATTKAALLRNLESQKDLAFHCHDCKAIARKLRLID